MTTAATRSRIPLRVACAAWSAVRKSSSKRSGRTVPPATAVPRIPPLWIPCRKSAHGSMKAVSTPQRQTSQRNRSEKPGSGSRPRTHTCALKRKRRFPACHQSAPRASSPSSGSADGRRRRDPRRTELSGCGSRQAAGRSLLSLWEIAGSPAELRLGMGAGRTGPYRPRGQRRSLPRMSVRCQKGKTECLP